MVVVLMMLMVLMLVPVLKPLSVVGAVSWWSGQGQPDIVIPVPVNLIQ